MGRSVLLAHGVSHRGGCAQVLPVQILSILDVVKEESRNTPLEIKIISVNRRQRVVFFLYFELTRSQQVCLVMTLLSNKQSHARRTWRFPARGPVASDR